MSTVIIDLSVLLDANPVRREMTLHFLEKDGATLICRSNFTVENTKFTLRHLNIHHYFDDIIYKDNDELPIGYVVTSPENFSYSGIHDKLGLSRKYGKFLDVMDTLSNETLDSN